MHRKFKLRRQLSLLLVAMRIGFGGTLLMIFFVNMATSGSLLAQIRDLGGASAHILFTSFTLSAALLVIDGLMDFCWPYISGSQADRIFQRSRWLRISWLQQIRYILMRGCALTTAARPWFYLPPAGAAIMVVPVAMYLGAHNVNAMQWLWLWLFVCGVSGALLEGAINNERNRYANDQ